MNIIMVNTKKKTRKVSKVAHSVEVGAYCDLGQIYKTVKFKRALIVFCGE